MIRKILPFISLGLLLTGATLAQTSARLAFEVATVKPSAPLDMAALRVGKAHIGTRIDASRVDIGTTPLFNLLCTAYRLRPYQISGPEWLKSTNFDIQAKIPDGVSADKVPDMLRTLLEERFGLQMHHDSKEQSVYALVVAKGGPKLTPSTPVTAAAVAAAEAAAAAPKPDAAKPGAPSGDGGKGAPPNPNGQPDSLSVPTLQGEVKMSRGPAGISLEMPSGEIMGKIRAMPVRGTGPMRMHLESSDTTMKTFASMLSVGVVDKPVVDMTGLTGSYEIAVDISEFDAMGVVRTSVNFLPTGGGGDGGNSGATGVASDPSGSAIRASIQAMGLSLEPKKLPLDLLVIDHIEKAPTEN
jgi:uncharacterized protein (TIGR03435 family)